MIENFNRETFSPQLNTTFLFFPAPAQTLELKLVEVTSEAGQKTENGERFSLVFRGPLATFLPQAIYKVEHSEIGAFDLFIVPIRRDAEGFYYEAIFNRQTPA